MYKRILVAYDGSEGARAALKQSVALAAALDAELSCVLVEEHLPHYAASISEVKAAKEAIDEHFHTLAKQARDAALLGGVDMDTIVRQGHEVETIVTTARDGKFDLLVVGYHGHSAIFGRILGSTAQSIVRLAPCPVLLAK
ncbi:MAG TPA: universal stress protein [Methylomirabilota bacterium]|jgi:nucleotide-binding universal stress UspA family protein|nr:universal stress protein [Methylomirabilota bacterium]